MVTPHFDTLQLHEMDKVKLMNRTDRKYWFNIEHLDAVLKAIQEDYYMLQIDGESMLPYYTTYFDTFSNKMYLAHHNGKKNRYKIRRRTYVNSEISFFEIKFKNNKGRTIKKRISTTNKFDDFSKQEEAFILKHTPFNGDDLKPVLINEFERLTLVNKEFNERCTIDFNLRFKGEENLCQMKNMAIVELKADGNSAPSPLAISLRDHRLKASGFSKYCTGRITTDRNIKQNNFKMKLRAINKTLSN